ncbi:MAG TPA: hypothetical protein VJC16_00995 [Candidatus Nanoarchaeia archaeon]|nr:hypothetical protein [Candidatus Nanoarchaeia archaeon]
MKGQGLSLNVIIIAALGLLVLVILSVIFIQRAGVFSTQTSGSTYCVETLSGTCAGTDALGQPVKSCADAGGSKIGTCDDGSFCCGLR